MKSKVTQENGLRACEGYFSPAFSKMNGIRVSAVHYDVSLQAQAHMHRYKHTRAGITHAQASTKQGPRVSRMHTGIPISTRTHPNANTLCLTHTHTQHTHTRTRTHTHLGTSWWTSWNLRRYVTRWPSMCPAHPRRWALRRRSASWQACARTRWCPAASPAVAWQVGYARAHTHTHTHSCAHTHTHSCVHIQAQKAHISYILAHALTVTHIQDHKRIIKCQAVLIPAVCTQQSDPLGVGQVHNNCACLQQTATQE